MASARVRRCTSERRDDVGAGIDLPRVTEWISAHIEGVTPPLAAPIAGGHSNLTYRVVDAAGRELVLRRPPLGNILSTAHDMGREHRHHRRPAARATSPSPPPSGCARTPRSTAPPSTSWPSCPAPCCAFLDDGLAYPEASRAPGGRHRRRGPGPPPRRRPRRRRARAPRSQGGLRRAPAAALARPVRAVQDPRAAASRPRSTAA